MLHASVFVGTSLDGYIARHNGAFDFLPPGGGEPHGYEEFMASVDASRDRSLGALMREPLFVPESMGVIELLARMRSQRIHLR